MKTGTRTKGQAPAAIPDHLLPTEGITAMQREVDTTLLHFRFVV